MPPLTYQHVDVFSAAPYSGNSLAVFPDARDLDAAQMTAITKELRHFESIFLTSTDDPHVVNARVFDLLEELDFAGHPVIGAACVLHHLRCATVASARWTVRLKARTVEVETHCLGPHFQAELDQGHAEFLRVVEREHDLAIAVALGIAPADLDVRFCSEVISTGLRYLVVPVTAAGLARARIADESFVPVLAALDAQFVYAIDIAALEGRHWNHIGGLEDVATGSGAGCVAAFLRRHDLIADGATTKLKQGRFTGRPSELRISAFGAGTEIRSVRVGGEVALVGVGQLHTLPTGRC